MPDWYIRDIVVYGRNDETRSVSLAPGVNIITGDSRTGKSALVPIVDYCLGSSDYEVPVGTIRDFAEWYGIRIQTPDGQLFLARKEPGRRSNTNSMHLVVGADVTPPTLGELTGNTERDTAVNELSRRLGLMDRSLAQSRFDTAYAEPPTARNVVPFLFQPQNVLANKDVLFYKTDDQRHRDHRRRLERIFPFVLGAIDSEYFRLRKELDAAQRGLRQRERQLSERQALSSGGATAARSLWDRCVALGLAGRDPAGAEENLDAATLRSRLVEVLQGAGTQPQRTPAVTGDPERASALEERSRTLHADTALLRRRIAEAEELDREARNYTDAVGVQAGRLRALALVPDAPPVDECPVCGQEVRAVAPGLDELRAAAGRVQAQLQGVAAASPALTRHLDNLRSQIAERRALLQGVESELAELYCAQNDALSADAAWAEQQRHLGAVRFYLDQIPSQQDETGELRRGSTRHRQRFSGFRAG